MESMTDVAQILQAKSWLQGTFYHVTKNFEVWIVYFSFWGDRHYRRISQLTYQPKVWAKWQLLKL